MYPVLRLNERCCMSLFSIDSKIAKGLSKNNFSFLKISFMIQPWTRVGRTNLKLNCLAYYQS